MTRMVLACLASALTAPPRLPATVQDTAVSPGDRVRFAAPSVMKGKRLGIVLENDGEWLLVRPSKAGQPVRIRLSAIERLELWRGERSMAYEGALIGLAAGAAWPVAMFVRSCARRSGCSLEKLAGGVFPGALSAAFGTIVAGRLSTERWKRLPAVGGRLGVGPLPRGTERIAAGDRIRFLSRTDPGHWRIANVLDRNSESLLVRRSDGRDAVRISLTSLDRLEVSRGRRPLVGEGALIGLLPGAVVGLLGGRATSARGFAGMVGAGTAVGALTGLAFNTDRWERVRTDVAGVGATRGVRMERRALDAVLSRRGRAGSTPPRARRAMIPAGDSRPASPSVGARSDEHPGVEAAP